MLKYDIVRKAGEAKAVTVFFGGGVSEVATPGHPNFNRIIEAVEGGATTAQEVRDLFDISVSLSNYFAELTERVSINNGFVFFDGMKVDNALTQQIVRYYESGEQEFWPLVRFMEKVYLNPNPHSREHLFKWMGRNDFAIAYDGDIIAYKGVRSCYDNTDNLLSCNSGRALVNGQVVVGQIPNNPGTIVTMPRDEVAFDPANGCSTGLHVANFSFARGFGDTIVRVKVNPRDVVSVPTDCDWQKVRVCRYRVLDVVTEPDTNVLYVGDPEVTARVVVTPAEGETKRHGFDRFKSWIKGVKVPKVYEDFTAFDFEAVGEDECEWLASAEGWGTGSAAPADLAREAERRKGGIPVPGEVEDDEVEDDYDLDDE